MDPNATVLTFVLLYTLTHYVQAMFNFEVEDLSQLKANPDPNRFDRKCRPLGSLSPMLSQ